MAKSKNKEITTDLFAEIHRKLPYLASIDLSNNGLCVLPPAIGCFGPALEAIPRDPSRDGGGLPAAGRQSFDR